VTPEEIKDFRARHGLTQQELADRLGLKHRDTVRGWERSSAPPSGPAVLAMRLIDRLTGEFRKVGRAVLDGLWRGS
jgi:DNA-binding transcriptional regulator YiaG